jgi:hypothetical protein
MELELVEVVTDDSESLTLISCFVYSITYSLKKVLQFGGQEHSHS